MERTANTAPELKRDRFPNAFRIGKNTHIPPRVKIIKNSWFAFIDLTGAPNENIVQNHSNIELLNVLKYLNGRYRHIFIP